MTFSSTSPHDPDLARTAAELGARVDRLPGWGLSKATLLLLAVSSAFSFYDITSMGVVLPTVAEDFGVTPSSLAIVFSVNLLGYIVGSITLGALADKIGRKPSYLITLAVLAISSLLTGLAWDTSSLAVFRFLTGVGTGAQIALVTTLFVELSSTKRRGFYLQANQIAAGVGLALAPWLAFALVPRTDIGWRIVLAAGALSALAMLLAFMMPESPRWLALRGRTAEAEQVVAGMEANLRAQGLVLPDPEPVTGATQEAPRGMLRTLLRPPYLGRVSMLLAFWFLFYLTSYSFLGYQTTLLANIGLLAGASILITAVSSFGYFLGPLAVTFLVQRFERKYLVVAVTGMEAAGFGLMAAAQYNWMAVLGGLLVTSGIMAATVGYTYTAELLPTEARASAVATVQSGGHIAGVCGPFLTVAVFGAFGARPTFVQFLTTILIGGALVLIFGKKTSGVGLGEASK